MAAILTAFSRIWTTHPRSTAQFLPANHLAEPFKQCRQHLKWLFLELYPLSPLVQFPGMEIDLEGTETNNS